MSSSAAANPGTALGVAKATDLFASFPSTWSGQSVGSTDALIRYTLNGDANLDKSVDTVDFNLLAANFGQSGKYWFNGDFNYDGSVDTIDFNLLASNFGQVMPSQPAGMSVGQVVPEPGSMVIAGLSFLLVRRKRVC